MSYIRFCAVFLAAACLLVGCVMLDAAQLVESPGETGVTASTRELETVNGVADSLWTAEDTTRLRALWIGSLPPVPPDPSNRYADNLQAAALGHQLFFDTRFSGNGQVSCATCHQPARHFTDGRPLSQGIGAANRNAMSIVGAAYSPWLFWDGRADSQWAQALRPLESPVEHGGARLDHARLIAKHYHSQYESLFGALLDFSDTARFPPGASPVMGRAGIKNAAQTAWRKMASTDREAVTRVFVNMGKAIAAYERLIAPGPARFDAYVEAALSGDHDAMRSTLNAQEIAGLRLFLRDDVSCTRCHNGPLFTNFDFHNTGAPAVSGLSVDRGRAAGAFQALNDEFNCLGDYSDASYSDCAELRFAKTTGVDLERAYKTPSLRNVAATAPYMHAGQYATLSDVLHHYNRAPVAPGGHSELSRLYLSQGELDQLEAFLRTLSGPLAVDPRWLEAPVLP